ncbi:MAG: 2OG-Fe(II) oxygenase [Pseudomonadota bacterium]|nr:2OG-Fe(II) oxygenase [Pseudomonadota bacterium]
MSILKHAQDLARSGKQREAIEVVEEAASAADPEALLAVANWRLFGLYGPRDHSAVHELLEKAMRAGSIEAGRMSANLIGNGTGCPSDPGRARQILRDLAPHDPQSKRQLAMLEEMKPEGFSAGEVLSETPLVRILRGFLLSSECRYLRAVAEPALRPSSVIDPRTGRQAPHPVRNSAGMNFGPADEDLVIHAINRRIAATTGTDVAAGEPLHILRYSPGQQYKPHVDALPGVDNQREWTVLLYLNAEYSGGETSFTELGITVRGNEGDALLFRNTTADGRGDDRTRHAGLPVISGVKWLGSRWIRQRPYSPW